MSTINKMLVVLSALAVSLCCASCYPKDDFTDILADEDYVYSEEPKKEKEPEPEDTRETKAQIEALAAAALEKLNKVPEYPEGYPTLEDVVTQYANANTAIGWIISTAQLATDAGDTFEANGMTYQRVKPDCHLAGHNHEHADEEKLIYNKETLEAYIATLIHPDEAKDYMIDLREGYEIPRIVSGDNGALYALPFTYTPSGYGDETYELTKNNDESYTFTVNYSVKSRDGGEDNLYQHSFPYTKVDGRWVFENFIVIRQ